MDTRVKQDIVVRPMQHADVAAADSIMRMAFGTFLGLPEPAGFMGNADYVQHRWRKDPSAAFVAVDGARVTGSNFASNWGSVGFFGPLTVHPQYWNGGVGQRLMQPVLDCFDTWHTAHVGLFTFAQSEKHVGLYRKFGFWPRFLSAVMSIRIEQAPVAPQWTRLSDAPADQQQTLQRECRAISDANFSGLDVTVEMRAAADQGLGDTVLLWDDGALAGFAICHCGPGSEAGSGSCHIKFGAVHPGNTASRQFERLVEACRAFAAASNLGRLTAGVNTARHEAYSTLLAMGFRTDLQGVAMHRDNDPGYNRPGVYLLDDWR